MNDDFYNYLFNPPSKDIHATHYRVSLDEKTEFLNHKNCWFIRIGQKWSILKNEPKNITPVGEIQPVKFFTVDDFKPLHVDSKHETTTPEYYPSNRKHWVGD